MYRTALFAVLLALSACASDGTQTAAAPGRDCFRSDETVQFTPEGDNIVRVRTSRGDYAITVSNGQGLYEGREPFVVRSSNGWICTGNGLGVDLRVGTPPRQLHVEQISRADVAGS